MAKKKKKVNWLDSYCLLEKCPNCGGEQFMCDYFEEEWFFWCGHCSMDLTACQQAMLYKDEENCYESGEDINESNRNEVKRSSKRS